MFWSRWRHEYLNTLQKRTKWQSDQPNLSNGDIVLLKDRELCRNEWPVGIVDNVLPSQDGKVRKAEVAIFKNGKRIVYTRPVTELILLLSEV